MRQILHDCGGEMASFFLSRLGAVAFLFGSVSPVWALQKRSCSLFPKNLPSLRQAFHQLLWPQIEAWDGQSFRTFTLVKDQPWTGARGPAVHSVATYRNSWGQHYYLIRLKRKVHPLAESVRSLLALDPVYLTRKLGVYPVAEDALLFPSNEVLNSWMKEATGLSFVDTNKPQNWRSSQSHALADAHALLRGQILLPSHGRLWLSRVENLLGYVVFSHPAIFNRFGVKLQVALTLHEFARVNGLEDPAITELPDTVVYLWNWVSGQISRSLYQPAWEEHVAKMILALAGDERDLAKSQYKLFNDDLWAARIKAHQSAAAMAEQALALMRDRLPPSYYTKLVDRLRPLLEQPEAQPLTAQEAWALAQSYRDELNPSARVFSPPQNPSGPSDKGGLPALSILRPHFAR